ncbi:MAG: acetylglutamate kinase [Clostridia bacterium]|nr:acetylglutamate kinase [Clostridia bacterium]MBQ3068607.1 acetylglutamate kinase [Clostridia bacterium]
MDEITFNSIEKKAEVLIEALPYITQYRGKTIVIKYGGNAMINEELKNAVISDIVLLSCIGINVVLVHGGGPEITDMLKRVGKESRFVNGLRYTDAETAEIAQMVLAGKINKDLVSMINCAGGNAIGISGFDGGLIKAKKKSDNGVDYGFVGEISDVNTKIIRDNLSNGYIVVVSTVAAGENGEVYNINADTAALEIAIALKADRVLVLTDVRGVLKDAHDESSLISDIKLSEIPDLIKSGIITGGMIPKIESIANAVKLEIKSASIIDGRVKHSIIVELFSHEGFGTIIHR